MTFLRALKPAILPLATLLAAATLAACSMGGMAGGGSTTAGALSQGLSARMDQPGATLNRAEAIGLINAYRATNGLPALVSDTALDGTAQALANQYAQTGTPPGSPQGLTMKLSAGYATFAETFSGWRNSPADAAGLRANATKAGVAVMFNPSSSYGIYWVLVLGN
ncbi:Cysteine-rich secretory protein family protein [Devosia sp. YR412]|uniref:CAP domain-containing protein n=1 Tax=Devosia sp. YR412 TaxID=1881030 RepID=UPI0008CF020E|nr:CAP domain-containing protein [Devosia sp. YR412]SEQ30213.1 Cysteine-rich secretory protein family protein [Devosia sp. YR412]